MIGRMPQYASDTIDDVHLALRGLSHRWAANGMPGSTSTSMCGGIGHVSTSPSGLLVVTFRPEFNAPWVGRPHVTSLTLN